MNDRYLHEGETLLCSRRSSPAVLIMVLLRGILETLIVCAILSVLIAGISTIGAGVYLPLWMYIALFLLCLTGIFYQHIQIWREATFRVTTERILVANPQAFFHAPLTTVKWPQYQECEVDHRRFLDVIFWARPLKIRYGTADAHSDVLFPSLRYAEDIKHYMDKIDAAVRKGDLTGLKPFVAQPRGRRD